MIENQKTRAQNFDDETDMVDAFVACGGRMDKTGHVKRYEHAPSTNLAAPHGRLFPPGFVDLMLSATQRAKHGAPTDNVSFTTWRFTIDTTNNLTGYDMMVNKPKTSGNADTTIDRSFDIVLWRVDVATDSANHKLSLDRDGAAVTLDGAFERNSRSSVCALPSL